MIRDRDYIILCFRLIQWVFAVAESGAVDQVFSKMAQKIIIYSGGNF